MIQPFLMWLNPLLVKNSNNGIREAHSYVEQFRKKGNVVVTVG